MSKAIFFHAGCPVCVQAEQQFVSALDPVRYQVEIVDLGTDKARIDEAANLGVHSVPALVIDEKAYHINFGAKLADLR